MERRLFRLSPSDVARGLMLAPIGPMLLFVHRAGEQKLPLVACSYAIVMISGVPVLWIFELFGLRRLWHYLIAGFAIPFVVGMGLLLSIAYDPRAPWARMLASASALGSLCAIGATTFWVIAVRPAVETADS